MGPYTQYAEPGVYTRTLADSTVASLTGGIRVPLFIGVGTETLTLTDQELVRGSSSIADNKITNEDVSLQFTGTNREFTVAKYPIVDGSGLGIITYDPKDVTVTIDDEPAGISQVFGDTGKIVLSTIPSTESVVKVSYYFKRTDTEISEEDLSVQVDGSNKEFKVNYPPIVDGTNGGIATTDTSKITVTINGTITTISAVDGQSGTFTFATAPLVGDIVKVTYWTNSWQDTFDYLPINNITKVVRVGTSPGRSDFTNTQDFVIDGNKIQWGNSVSVNAGTTAANTTALDDTKVYAYIYDNKVYARPTTGTVNGINKSFYLEYVPTSGTGKGDATDDVTKVTVYVGATVQAAMTAGAVEVEELYGSSKKVVLKVAPTSGNKVFVTYWHNMLADDTYELSVVTTGTSTVAGTYTLSSLTNGSILAVTEDKPSHYVADPNFAVEGITFPAGGIDIQTIPGYSVEETILLNFFNSTDYLVLSSIGENGSQGSGTLGQTYIDSKTGLRFTIMHGDTVTYSSGDLLEFDIENVFTASTLYTYSIPGIKLQVQSLLGTAISNTSNIDTYNKSGSEPSVGDFYYVTVEYAKTSYPIKIYTKLKDVVSAIGAVNTDNRLSLAAYLAFSNGAIALALAQVLRDSTGVDASTNSYSEVLSTVESPIFKTNIKPSIICPITTNTTVINNVRLHCEKMSNERNRGERVGIYGHAVGTTPEYAQSFAKKMKSERLIGIYPDGAIIGLVDELGNTSEAAVDGSFLAAALSGLAVNPIYDVATPLTHKTLNGFTRLIRNMDAVTMNQCAVSGLTVLENQIPNLLIRQAMTTNPTNVLTREPTVIFIKDFVQQEMRATLDPYIGLKMVASLVQDVETSVNNLLNNMVNNEIITAFTGTAAEQDSDDPTILRVETYYSPVFPLNWIVMTFNLRVRV